MYKTAEVLRAGMVDMSKVITHRFDMEEFSKAFALMKSGRCGKVIMYPTDEKRDNLERSTQRSLPGLAVVDLALTDLCNFSSYSFRVCIFEPVFLISI